MMRSLAAVLFLVAACAAGCPDPQEVGAIPHQQVDDARQRVDRAEQKLEKRAAEADAAKE